MAVFLFGIVWGWEGEEERQFFAVLSSIALFSVWYVPFLSIVDASSIVTVNNWLTTSQLFWLSWFNVALMYFTAAHLMQTLNREEPVGRAIKRLRKR